MNFEVDPKDGKKDQQREVREVRLICVELTGRNGFAQRHEHS